MQSELKHRNFSWPEEKLYLNDVGTAAGCRQGSPENPGAPQEGMKPPWSLSPDSPEGISAVHKTC